MNTCIISGGVTIAYLLRPDEGIETGHGSGPGYPSHDWQSSSRPCPVRRRWHSEQGSGRAAVTPQAVLRSHGMQCEGGEHGAENVLQQLGEVRWSRIHQATSIVQPGGQADGHTDGR